MIIVKVVPLLELESVVAVGVGVGVNAKVTLQKDKVR